MIEAILFASSFVPEDSHSASACYQSEKQCYTTVNVYLLRKTFHTTVRMQKCLRCNAPSLKIVEQPDCAGTQLLISDRPCQAA